MSSTRSHRAGGRAARLTRAAPNKALEPTPNSLRSYVAPAVGRGSPPALGPAGARQTPKTQEAAHSVHNRDRPRQGNSQDRLSQDRRTSRQQTSTTEKTQDSLRRRASVTPRGAGAAAEGDGEAQAGSAPHVGA